MYNIGLYIYQLAIFIASFFNEKARKLRDGQSEAFAILKEKAGIDKKYIWFHAASLGEFEQGRPVIEKLKQIDPETKILLTFFSPSGYEIRKSYAGADIICYLPLDTVTNVSRFLNSVKISKAIFIKYEFWPNYLKALKANKIPFYSISAIFRPDQVFFKWYGSWYRNLLKSFNHIFVQDDNSLNLLENHGFKNATTAGDTRFDRVADLAKQTKTIALVEAFIKGAKKVIVAGSSWPKDEELLVEYLKKHSDIKLILFPHEIHESHITGIIKLTDNNYIRFTEANEQNMTKANCLIVDTIGILSTVYQYASVAYIGGGFGVGIHNTLEAAVWNIPVVFGPNYQKFREAKELIAKGGAFTISDYNELEKSLDTLLIDKNAGKIAGEYVKMNTGATDLIIKEIL